MDRLTEMSAEAFSGESVGQTIRAAMSTALVLLAVAAGVATPIFVWSFLYF